MALCPNCSAAIAVTAGACANCKAEFGANAAWHPLPQSAAEQDELARLQSARPKEPARPDAQGTLLLVLVMELFGLLPWYLVAGLSWTASNHSAKDFFFMGPIWVYPVLILICTPLAFQFNAEGRISTATKVVLAPLMISGGWVVVIMAAFLVLSLASVV